MSADPTFMYTLAGAASTFVAILAGFYTTKIFSITADKNRLENNSKKIRLEIKWKSDIVERFRTQVNDKIDQDQNDHVSSFLNHMKSNYFKKIESLDDILKYYEEYFEEKPIESISTKLAENYEPFSNEFNQIWNANQEKERERERERERKRERNRNQLFGSILDNIDSFEDREISLPPMLPDDASRVISSNESLEEEKRFLELKKEYEREKINLEFLETQLEEYSQEIKSILYPNLKFGFLSFVLFAILGVIIPLTYTWWDDYLNQYSDLFALSTFGIGMFCTFLYIFIEIFVSSKGKAQS